jgi:hypothetical protein
MIHISYPLLAMKTLWVSAKYDALEEPPLTISTLGHNYDQENVDIEKGYENYHAVSTAKKNFNKVESTPFNAPLKKRSEHRNSKFKINNSRLALRV